MFSVTCFSGYFVQSMVTFSHPAQKTRIIMEVTDRHIVNILVIAPCSVWPFLKVWDIISQIGIFMILNGTGLKNVKLWFWANIEGGVRKGSRDQTLLCGQYPNAQNLSKPQCDLIMGPKLRGQNCL